MCVSNVNEVCTSQNNRNIKQQCSAIASSTLLHLFFNLKSAFLLVGTQKFFCFLLPVAEYPRYATDTVYHSFISFISLEIPVLRIIWKKKNRVITKNKTCIKINQQQKSICAFSRFLYELNWCTVHKFMNWNWWNENNRGTAALITNTRKYSLKTKTKHEISFASHAIVLVANWIKPQAPHQWASRQDHIY